MMRSVDRSVWMRRGRRAAIVVLVLVVLFELFGFFIAPGLIRSIATEQIASALGRKATIGDVRFNPLVLAATLDDVRLYQADEQGIALRADRLRVDVSTASLFKRALVFDGLKIVKPQLHVARLAPDRFDFSDIIDKLAAQPKSEHPLPYSINNIEVDDGTIDIDDRVGGQKHVVDEIRLGLPFISNLPYDATIFVTPAFHARIDGSTIALTGKAQPFSDTREAVVAFDVADLDVTQVMSLAPSTLPFRIASGKLSAKLAITFKAATKDATGKAIAQALHLSGQVGIATLNVTDRAGRHALGVKTIAVDITQLDPIGGGVALASVAVDAPDIDATRRADGSIDLLDLFRMPAAAPGPPSPAKSSPAPFAIAALSITGGHGRFVDQAVAPASTTTISDVVVKAEHVALEGTTPATWRASLAADEGLTVGAEGSAVIAKRQVDGVVDVKGFKPTRVAPYLAPYLTARVDGGNVDAHARFRLDASGPALAGSIDEASLHIAQLHTTLADAKVTPSPVTLNPATPKTATPKTATLFGAEAIALDGARFDFATHAFAADSLALTAPVVAIRRDAKGSINLQSMIVATKPVEPPAATSSATATPGAVAKAAPFTAVIKSLSIDRGDITFDDLALATPVHVRAQPLAFRATDVGTAAGTVVSFTLDSAIDQRGKLVVDGKAALMPLNVDARIAATQLAVGWLAGYAGDQLAIAIDSADLDTKGALHVARGQAADAPLAIGYRGSLSVARMRARDRVTSEPFVEWKTLDVPMVDFRMPAPRAPLAVVLGEVAVSDFYARLIVNANGRLNLQDVVSKPGERQSVTTPEAGGAIKPAAAAAPVAAAPKPSITVASVKLVNGRIGITDNFIKPNYSATLTELDGGISTIASDDPKPSALKLSGRIDGEGTLSVDGSLDAFAPTTFTDISATAKDIELTRLTPYAVKYAGYAIDRGKLSMTVKYRIENDRLQASNQLFLDQLTFGAHDPTATADLPVRLAVALLANAKGEIAIELPISGSLSDPQFSVGGVLGRALLNLVARAVTSPFALIGAAFGGGGNGELGYIQFMPGVSDLTPMGKTKLETLAKALADRPALRLDIIGRYDPATDADGIKRDHLLDRLKDLQAAALSRTGERVSRDDVKIADAAEHDRLLAQLYDATKLADKPRNVIGLAKSLPTAEMERLLLDDIKLDPNDPRWLAEARADVVRHYIEGTGKIAAGRVFLVTPKLNADGINDQGVPNRVDFAIR